MTYLNIAEHRLQVVGVTAQGQVVQIVAAHQLDVWIT